MIRVLIVDDSATAAHLLSRLFSSDPEFSVVGIASNGNDAINMAAKLKPDIISMDVIMPDMDGFEVTRKIMSTQPTPIVIVSSDQVSMSFRALEAGALAAIAKPQLDNQAALNSLRDELLFTFRAMAEVKLVRRTQRTNNSVATQPQIAKPSQAKIVVIGASTGGPQALQEILKDLPSTFPLPIVIVQHISTGFTDGLVRWLSQSCVLPIHVVTENQLLQGGHVYIAPEEKHLEITKDKRLKLGTSDKEHGVCPSVSHFFRSVAQTYHSSVIGILLSGMGRDGAAELKLLRDLGATTIAQDQESSVVHGMPGEAIRLGGASHILPASAIASTLCSLITPSDTIGC
ncbi:chemotaxis-specific protein-glutamate methyltransferase CheB [uncultured Tolumonas sp.]|uniref:chemotaxis-specific protein-glutamate methyltransferase CheB n=1 Tax=uncultured Tolumonas sp. TaxID=263765 RepID=UPI002A0A37A6|nr:chemotaxis-specific protein-glutamate methyltransferase CheB [uncultured Tolumonas sp.]